MRCTQWQHNMTVIEYKQQQKNDDFLPVLKDRDVVDERWWQDRNTTYELFCGSITTTSHLSMHCRCYLINVKVNVSPEQRHYNITPVYAGVIKLQLTIARLRLHASMISICLSVCLSPKCKKTRFSQKLSNLQLRCLLTTYRKSYMGFSKNPLLDPYNPRWLRSAILKIDMTSFFSAEGGPICIKFCRLVQNDMSTVVICGNWNQM